MKKESNFTCLCRIYSVVFLYILYICSVQFSFSGFWDGLFGICLSLICIAILGIVISDLISELVVAYLNARYNILGSKIKTHLFAFMIAAVCGGVGILARRFY